MGNGKCPRVPYPGPFSHAECDPAGWAQESLAQFLHPQGSHARVYSKSLESFSFCVLSTLLGGRDHVSAKARLIHKIHELMGAHPESTAQSPGAQLCCCELA